ncbi:MAG TPA: methyltransferase domain-containing protein [Desulfomonilaceae bacterium]|nr:methyltransferase domain-containing protein [Desulfomonilaceae bacterium]
MKKAVAKKIPWIMREGFSQHLKFAHFPCLAEAILRERLSVPAPLRILDVGCGPGNLAVFCGAEAGCRLFGVDLWPNQLRQAATKEAYEGLFQVNLVDGLPFESGSFDIVVCNEVLMYLPNAAEALAEFYRVLTVSGKLFVYNPISALPKLFSVTKRLMRRIYKERTAIALDVQSNWKEAERACRITYYSFQSLIEQISSAKFHITGITGFRLFRNRIRLMRRLENYAWYRRTILLIAGRYPRLASDLLVVGHKEKIVETQPLSLDKAAA